MADRQGARRAWRIGIVIALTGVTVLGLAGCSDMKPGPAASVPHDAATGGQTLNEAVASIESVPGLRVSDARTGAVNANGVSGIRMGLELEPGYRILDGGALATFVIETLWSIREGYQPNADIQLSLQAPGDDTVSIGQAAQSGGWLSPDATPRAASNGASSVTVRLYDNDRQTAEGDDTGTANLTRLGGWPGAVPEAPAGAVAKTD